MRNKILLVSGLLSLTTTTAAQVTSYTFPKGFNTTAGNASFFGGTDRRYMGIDNTHQALVAQFKTFALRRKGSSATAAITTSADVTLELGESEMDVVYSEMDRNYIPNSRTMVFPTQTVNWTLPAVAAAPAPFDVKISLATPYLYLGLKPLVWDLKLEKVPSTFSIDRDFTFYSSGSSVNLGAGCSSFDLNSVMETNGPALPQHGMRLRVSMRSAPASVPVSLSIATSDANATVPGFCAKVHAIPLLALPMGMSSSTGQVFNHYFNAPYTASFQGLSLVTQAYAPGTTGLALSTGESSTMPSSTQTNGHESLYIWAPLSRVPNNGTAFTGGSILVQMGI